MSDRYSKLFSLPENLYAQGSPVLIAAGALLKDNQTGKVLSQLKFQNINEKSIKALTVRVVPLDTLGQPLGDTVEYQYLDLTAERDSYFGQKEPVKLPDVSTRSFSASVLEVIFSDNSVWSSLDGPWEALESPQKLSDIIKDDELLKQYRMTYGDDCKYSFLEISDLWFCTCGALNHQGTNSCYNCAKSYTTLKTIDLTVLEVERDKRLQEEQQEREEAEQKRREEIAKRKNAAINVLKSRLFRVILSIIVICIIILLVVSKVAIPYSKYKAADDLYESGQYQEAIQEFKSLGSFKDSPDRVVQAEAEIQKESDYKKAMEFYRAQDYDFAITMFNRLGDYKDSKEKVVEVENAKKEDANQKTYNKAQEKFESERYGSAIPLFRKLGDYRDSKQKLAEAEKAADDAYMKAEKLYEEGKYDEAISAFQDLENYKDCKEKVREINKMKKEENNVVTANGTTGGVASIEPPPGATFPGTTGDFDIP